MKFERMAGILLHPTSLPGKYGIGDFGKSAYDFINFLSVARQSIWQTLPLNPTGYGDSPYQSPSAFAGNPLLISPDILKKEGFIKTNILEKAPEFSVKYVEFDKVREYKELVLRESFDVFINSEMPELKKSYNQFCKTEKNWLDDYSLFMALKKHFGEAEWTEWETGIKNRLPEEIKKISALLKNEIEYHKFLQFVFFHQWDMLKKYANSKGIKLFGDIPLFVSFDSADVWANKNLFMLDKDGEPKYVAGVPPDYFSATGQLWGNPHYDWKEMEKDDFKWWRDRFSSLLKVVDIIRIDHFRGLYDYWQIPGNAENAIKGKWVKGPADRFFLALKKYFGEIPIIAEDLGLLNPEVFKLRDRFELPGMKILQFAFGDNGEKHFLPHNYPKNCVVYTGTHDNNTTKGWWDSADKETKDWCRKYTGSNGVNIVNDLIRIAYSSVADIAIIPMQDFLNLGSEARMNFPSTLGGNWSWRFEWTEVPWSLNKEIAEITILFERSPLDKKKEDE